MNATDKAEALRLLDDLVDVDRLDVPKYRKLQRLRSLLSAEVSGIVSPDDPWSCPLPEHWRQAFVDYCYPSTIGDLPQRASDWIEQRARELARKGVGNG